MLEKKCFSQADLAAHTALRTIVYYGLLPQFCAMYHFFVLLCVFVKENSSSDNGLQTSEDEGAALPIEEEDPGKDSDRDTSGGAADISTKFLDEAPPKSAMKQHLARRPSLTRGQCCTKMAWRYLISKALEN